MAGVKGSDGQVGGFVQVIISNEIFIKDPTPDLVKWTRDNLNITNPEYSKKMRMGLYVGKTPPIISLYRVDGNTIILPCGTGKNIRSYLPADTYFVQDLADNGTIEYPGVVPLFDYQHPAVDAMIKAGCGILQSPCGSGKTQMGISLAAKLQRKTLWVTHTQDLLKQSYDRAIQYFPENIMGTITAGKVRIGSHMTFATVQTLIKLNLEHYKYTWDTVIVDECHRLAGSPTSVTMFYKVMCSLAARYKYGLSATVHRSDGLIKSTFSIIGDVQYRVPDESVAEKTMKVKVYRRNTGIETSRACLDTDGTMVYMKLIQYLVDDFDRNSLIVNDLISSKNHSCLILSDRIEHLKTLKNMLPEGCKELAVMIDGKMVSKTGKQQRAKAIEDMRSGKKRYLFASYSLAKEGLDIPRLDRLFLTTPKKDYAVVTQSIGRIARTYDGKQDAVCYDYVDAIEFCENQFKKRKTSYKKAGCEFV